ncbi:MAG TPA: NUDIX hydrolase [Gaiellales bacterium]|nr:NUDIX hydrolase [Gaiellales bacterium]
MPTPDPGRQRFAAYGLVVDDRRRVLLVRASSAAAVPGVWYPPGGGVEYGEHPEQAVLRELSEETGYVGRVIELCSIVSDTVDRADPADQPIHSIRLIYRLELVSGELRDEAGGTTDRAAWVTAQDATTLTLAGFLAPLLAEAG